MSDIAKKWDVFISHASEDKDAFVRPLAHALSNLGVKVWYDEFSIRLGDSLSRSIDKGLAESAFGIVIISHYRPNYVILSKAKDLAFRFFVGTEVNMASSE